MGSRKEGCCLPGLPFWAPDSWLSKPGKAHLAQISITSRNVLELDFMKRIDVLNDGTLPGFE